MFGIDKDFQNLMEQVYGPLNKEILELAKSCGFDSFTGEKDDGTNSDYWECWERQLLKFAALIYTEGFKVGLS